MRDKKRYMLVRNAEWEEITEAVRNEFGRVYAGLAGIKKIEENKNYTILRVQRDFDWLVRAAIALYDFGKPVWVERCSGSLRRLRSKGGLAADRKGGVEHGNAR